MLYDAEQPQPAVNNSYGGHHQPDYEKPCIVVAQAGDDVHRHAHGDDRKHDAEVEEGEGALEAGVHAPNLDRPTTK